jgi:hypothetical protein
VTQTVASTPHDMSGFKIPASRPGVETVVARDEAWQAALGKSAVAEGAWDDARQVLRLPNGRERDLRGATRRGP